jgi:hypothetical protein
MCFAANIPTIHKARVPYGWIIGGLGIGLALIVLCIIICVSLKSSSCLSESRGSHAKPPDGKISQKFHILRKQSFCCTSRRSICCKSVDWKQTNGESSSHQITIPKGFTNCLSDFDLYINSGILMWRIGFNAFGAGVVFSLSTLSFEFMTSYSCSQV